MKKLMLPLVTIGLFSVLSVVPVFAFSNPQYNSLYATKQMIEVGTMYTWNDETNLHITFSTWKSDWVLEEVHVAVGIDNDLDGNPPDSIPQTKSGNPKVGKFPYKSEGLGGIKDIEFVIPLSSIDDGATLNDHIAIAAHAVVSSPCGRETAWANCGAPKGYFTGNNWAVFYYYKVTY